MKKSSILSFVLAIVLVFSLAACSGGDGGSSSGSQASGGGTGTASAPGSFEVGTDTVEEEAPGASEYDPTYTVNLKVLGGDDTVLYNGTVTLKGPTMWANEFLRAAVTDKGLAQSGIEVGFVDTIGDYVNNSTDGIYWTYTVNGVSPLVGSNQYQLRDGDYMLWTYAAFE